MFPCPQYCKQYINTTITFLESAYKIIHKYDVICISKTYLGEIPPQTGANNRELKPIFSENLYFCTVTIRKCLKFEPLNLNGY